jgi:DNA invertase Pin-like site-specific DNA recombinase
MKNRLTGYARISTADQTLRQQTDALTAAGCGTIFEDTISGAALTRDGLDACLESLEPGDTLIVVALDRLGRSMAHLVNTVHSLAERGIGFRSLRESIDTTSAAGRLVLHMFAALADFERELIRERTKSALAAKKSRGETLGRKRSLTPSQVREAKEIIDAGKGVTYAARLFDVDRATLYRAMARTAA